MIECNKCKAQVNLKVKEERIPGTELDAQYIQCEECKKEIYRFTERRQDKSNAATRQEHAGQIQTDVREKERCGGGSIQKAHGELPENNTEVSAAAEKQ